MNSTAGGGRVAAFLLIALVGALLPLPAGAQTSPDYTEIEILGDDGAPVTDRLSPHTGGDWTADGSAVAYLSLEDRPEPGLLTRTYIYDVASGTRTIVGDGTEFDRVAIANDRSVVATQQGGRIFAGTPTTGQTPVAVTELFGNGFTVLVAVSDDGRYVVARSSGAAGIQRYDRTTGLTETVITDRAVLVDGPHQVSADASRFLASSADDSPRQTVVVDANPSSTGTPIPNDRLRVESTTRLLTNPDGSIPTGNVDPGFLSEDGTAAVVSTAAEGFGGTGSPAGLYHIDLTTDVRTYLGEDVSGRGISADGATVRMGLNSTNGVQFLDIATGTTATYSHPSSAQSGRSFGRIVAPDVRYSLGTTPSGAQAVYILGDTDDTPPVVTCTTSTQPNDAGWFTDIVTVVCAGTDDSGSITPQTDTVLVDGDGADQLITSVPFCDPAQNCARGTITVSIDQADPTVDVTVEPAANAFGWHNTDATVTATCSDVTSGIDFCPAAVTIDADGADQTVEFTGSDIASNTTTATATVSRDTVAPVLIVSSTSDGAQIPVEDEVAPTCDAQDDLSGIDGSCTITVDRGDVIDGAQTVIVTATATDRASNTSTVSRTYTVIVDRAAPIITATYDAEANAHGWFDRDVTLSFTCEDASPIANCPDPITVTEGANQSVTVTAADIYTNTATLTVAGINVDATEPTLTLEGLGTYTVADDVTINCSAADDLSGIKTVQCPTVDGSPGELAPGSYTIVATATDAAGNTTTTTGTYTITVTDETLGDLVVTYLGDEPGSRGLANAFRSKLDSGEYDAFIDQVEAKCCTDADRPGRGKRFTRLQASTLIALATSLRNS